MLVGPMVSSSVGCVACSHVNAYLHPDTAIPGSLFCFVSGKFFFSFWALAVRSGSSGLLAGRNSFALILLSARIRHVTNALY